MRNSGNTRNRAEQGETGETGRNRRNTLSETAHLLDIITVVSHQRSVHSNFFEREIRVVRQNWFESAAVKQIFLYDADRFLRGKQHMQLELLDVCHGGLAILPSLGVMQTYFVRLVRENLLWC